MSATCQRVKSSGYSLLEVLVVVAIASTAAAVVVPATGAYVDARRRAAAETAVTLFVEGLPDRAIDEARTIVFDDAAWDEWVQMLDPPLPEGYFVTSEGPDLVVHPNGVCGDGELTIHDEGGALRHFRVLGPFCRLEPTDG